MFHCVFLCSIIHIIFNILPTCTVFIKVYAHPSILPFSHLTMDCVDTNVWFLPTMTHSSPHIKKKKSLSQKILLLQAFLACCLFIFIDIAAGNSFPVQRKYFCAKMVLWEFHGSWLQRNTPAAAFVCCWKKYALVFFVVVFSCWSNQVSVCCLFWSCTSLCCLRFGEIQKDRRWNLHDLKCWPRQPKSSFGEVLNNYKQ